MLFNKSIKPLFSVIRTLTVCRFSVNLNTHNLCWIPGIWCLDQAEPVEEAILQMCPLQGNWRPGWGSKQFLKYSHLQKRRETAESMSGLSTERERVCVWWDDYLSIFTIIVLFGTQNRYYGFHSILFQLLSFLWS